MSSTILTLFVNYGVIILVIVLIGASCALPLPASLLLITAGALSQDAMPLWQVFIYGIVATVIGDHLGYFIGRAFGVGLNNRLGDKFAPAQKLMDRWGMVGIFLSRWLFTVVGGWLNLFCGMIRYPLWKFTIMDVLGEIIWVVSYASLGYAFQSQVENLNTMLGNFSYAALGVVAIIFFAYKLVRPIIAERRAVKVEAEA